MIDALYKNRLPLLFVFAAASIFIFFAQSKVPSDQELERRLLQVPPLFESWKSAPENADNSAALAGALEKASELKLIYDPLIAEVGLEKNNTSFSQKAQDDVVRRLEYLLPDYALFSKASISMAKGETKTSLEQILALQKSSSLEKNSLLYRFTLLQKLALREKLHILEKSDLPEVKALFQDGGDNAEEFEDIFGPKSLSHYLKHLETIASTAKASH